jgi:hypothetical protein
MTILQVDPVDCMMKAFQSLTFAPGRGVGCTPTATDQIKMYAIQGTPMLTVLE